MDKEELQKRLHDVEVLRDHHEQDIKELTYVIDGLRKELKQK